ncbi:unnamed protein product [Urochloa humidicola]
MAGNGCSSGRGEACSPAVVPAAALRPRTSGDEVASARPLPAIDLSSPPACSLPPRAVATWRRPATSLMRRGGRCPLPPSAQLSNAANDAPDDKNDGQSVIKKKIVHSNPSSDDNVDLENHNGPICKRWMLPRYNNTDLSGKKKALLLELKTAVDAAIAKVCIRSKAPADVFYRDKNTPDHPLLVRNIDSSVPDME